MKLMHCTRRLGQRHDRLAAVDAWIAEQNVPMTRPEAMLDAVFYRCEAPGREAAERKRGGYEACSTQSKHWTNVEDERLRSLVIFGMNTSGIAAELERTVAAVRFRAERFGLSLRRITVAPSRRLVEIGLRAKK
jgi:hypothetical protein